MYCEQRIALPAASAENAWITNTLMESTRDTADIAAEPTLLTIMVSTVPIREFSTCSKNNRYQQGSEHFVCKKYVAVLSFFST